MICLKTERLTLGPISEAHLEALTALLTDETVGKTYMVPDFPDRRAAEKLARRIMELSRGEERLVVGIFLDRQLIGVLNETEAAGDEIELGYALLPRFHNRGFATEALRAAIGACFDRGFRCVRAGAFRENSASLRVMEKCGMQRIARTDRIDYRGQTRECLYCAVQRP